MQATGPKSKSRSRVARIPWRFHSDEDVVARVKALTGGRGVDCIVEVDFSLPIRAC